MSNIYIKLIANHPVLKQTILDIMQMKKEQGDNTPLFVAPKNEERPDKNWTIGVISLKKPMVGIVKLLSVLQQMMDKLQVV